MDAFWVLILILLGVVLVFVAGMFAGVRVYLWELRKLQERDRLEWTIVRPTKPPEKEMHIYK